MSLPAVRVKSGEYFLMLNNEVSLPTKNLKVVIPQIRKYESSVARTHSNLGSFQIDISQPVSEVKATSVAPFVMQPASVQNLPVKRLHAVHENVKSRNSGIESDIPEKVRSCEINIPALQHVSSNNSTLKGSSSKCLGCKKIFHITESELHAANAACSSKEVVLDENWSGSFSRTAKSSNNAVDRDSHKSSKSFQINVTTPQYMPEVRESAIASHAEPSPQVQNLSTLVFFDLETTGLPCRGAPKVQITELSMIAVSKKDFEKSQFADLRDIRIVNKMCICVRPTVGVSPRVARITGLDDCSLQNHQAFDEDTAIMIQIFIAKLPKPVCLLAHNGNLFDFPLLKSELQNVGVHLPADILTADTLSAFRGTGICFSSTDNTITWSRNVKSKGKTERPSYALHKLYAKCFNEEAVSSHSAEGDCKALMMVCHKAKDNILPWICQNTRQFTSFKPMWN